MAQEICFLHLLTSRFDAYLLGAARKTEMTRKSLLDGFWSVKLKNNGRPIELMSVKSPYTRTLAQPGLAMTPVYSVAP